MSSESDDEKDKAAATGADADRAEAKASERDAEPAAVEPSPAAPAAPRTTIGQWVFLVGVAGVTAALDLWSKAWAIRRLSLPRHDSVPLCVPPPGATHYSYQRLQQAPVEVIRGYLDFTYAENCGGAWGLLHGARESLRKPFFMLVTVGAVLFIIHLYRTLEPQQRSMRLALPLVLGGAIGNLVDRIRLGYVVDFIHMHLGGRWSWPTYNVADIAITVGIALMLLEYVIGPRKPAPKVKPARPAAG